MRIHRRRIAGRRLAISVAIIAMAIAAPVASAAPATPDPILLVHGYRGDPSTWADMKAYLEGNGRTVAAIDLATEDNVKNAQAISAFLAAKGWTRVDLVGQSMGGLSARHFTKALRGNVVVDSYTSLGTPQYGIYAACLLPVTNGGQMCPSSSFLRTLNTGDDTPGGTTWTTIYSTNDEVVPNAASRLDGGACHVQVSGPRHNDMDNDAAVMAHVLASVDGTCTGTFK
ncbi:MAG TPA: alpha/beta fold hydrolase [Patescibacteria group bacterium]|nr:alpha/beta fold hydrolase [Patescibacteria group bacterium]